jgi:hypothetical protein
VTGGVPVAASRFHRGERTRDATGAAKSDPVTIRCVFYETRTFRTPTLETGKLYHYIARAEIVRDGKVENETQYNAVKPRKEITITFQSFTPSIARK